jgi:hypothetical protein
MNVSFASPPADVKYAQIVGHPQIDGVLASISELSGWTIALTVLGLLVAYDQSELLCIPPEITHLLMFLQSVTYGRRVQSLAQHGKFLSLVHSSSQWIPNSKNIWQNGLVDLSAVCLFFTSKLFHEDGLS